MQLGFLSEDATVVVDMGNETFVIVDKIECNGHSEPPIGAPQDEMMAVIILK
jgi:hypothetical protein